MLTGVAVGVAATALFAADVSVSNDDSLLLGNGETIVPNTLTVGDTLPDIGVDPIFWIDASDTNGWEFASGKPKKIPSKVGTRYLKNYKEDGDHLLFSTYPYGATLVQAGLNGKPYLDFGSESGGNGYVFNPVEQDGGGTANRLDGIGTVIAVYGSQNGGGYFVFGGGTGASAGAGTRDGDVWNRGNDSQQEGASYRYAVPMFGAQALTPLYYAKAYFDGYSGNARFTGFNGGWQVVTMKADTTTANAYGVGLNATTRDNNGWNRRAGGGMRIAEVVVYGEFLTNAQRMAVEAYLQKKWMGRTMPGTDGQARVGRVKLFSTSLANAGVAAGANVPSDQTLDITELLGGRGTAPSFTKSGDGTLVLGTAGDYHGTFKLVGGTLKMKRMDKSAVLPATSKILLHLDTTGAIEDNFETEVRDDVTYVMKWKNLAEGRKSAGKAFYAAQATAAQQPMLVSDASLGGMVVDFGPNVSGGRYLNLSTDTTPYANAAMPIVGSTFVIVSSEFCGKLFGADNDGGAFARGSAGYYAGNNVAAPIWASGYPTSVNGVPIKPTKEGEGTVGYCLLASQIPGAGGCGRIAGTTGGLKIAEMVVYDHLLSDEEFRQAQAALMAKWFDCDRFGLPTKYDIDRLVVDAPSTIEIPEGVTVKVRSLVCNAKLEKRGNGTLEVDATSNIAESGIAVNFVLRSGAFRFVTTDDVVEDASAPAGDPLFHFDATDSATLTVNDSGKVSRWREVGTSARANELIAGTSPAYVADAFGEGLPGVDFVDGNKVALNDYSGANLYFARPLDSIRTYYAVVANLDRGGFFLGVVGQNDANWTDDRDLLDFSRNGTMNYFLSQSGNYAMVVNAPKFIDGESATSTTVVDEKPHLIEIHALGNAYASAVARNAIGHWTGGITIGEMIAYDRPLTDREKAATRNYLQKKWFGKSEFEPLPAKAPESTAIAYENFEVEDGAEYTVDDELVAGLLIGEGSIVKSGEGTMKVRDLTSFAGTVAVAAGTLKITGNPPPVEPKMPDSVPQVHLDASVVSSLTLVKDSKGVDRVTEWRSLTDNGWKAVPRTTSTVSQEKPTYVPDESIGMRSTLRWGNYWPGMSFRDADNTATQTVKNIRSALWIIGSQEGGGFLLGSGDTMAGAKDNFHRNDPGYGGNASDGLFLSSAADGCRTAEMYVNDMRISGSAAFQPYPTATTPMTQGLSGGWDFVSMRVSDPYENKVWADGLCYSGHDSYYRDGRQRLAEVAIYTNLLSAADVQAAGYYLRIKWGLIDLQHSLVNSAGVNLAADATLDLGGTNQYLRVVGGAGDVVNGNLTASALVASPEGPLSVSGSFTATNDFTVDLSSLPAGLEGDLVLLTAAGGIGNPAAIRSATITVGEYPDARVHVRGNAIVVSLQRSGMVLIVR